MTVAGIRQPMLEAAIVGEQHQPLAVVVKATRGINIRNGHIVLKGKTTLRILKLAQNPVGLIENDVAIDHGACGA